VERSDAHALWLVMLDAKEVIKALHLVTFAAHVASRVWVIRRTDFEAWKKELEFC